MATSDTVDNVKELGKDAADIARNTKSDAMDVARNAKDDAMDLASRAKADALEKTGELSKKCMAFLDSALAAAKEVPSVAAARTKEVAATTDDYVHQNPWRAVTISAGVGLLLGVLFSRR